MTHLGGILPKKGVLQSPNLSSFSLNLNEDVASDSTSSQRPIGVKKAKLKRKIEEGFSSAMQMVQSENNRLVELLAKSGVDRQRDLEMKDKALKLKEFKEENKILLSNLDSIGDPNIREFILQEQKRIMDKRSQQFQQPQPQKSSAPYTQYFNDIGGSGNDLPELYIRNYYVIEHCVIY
ncbi:uncharacterized protein LOC132629123 [Lycium barbarum]|uniref:uncharacterized protein LOC132629123 n=1 Tax=Lycium barbarum TaxID=112863 RepID=UPI00293E4591|nr:uncharacterized protein LOC132629123 [Lycium barbarum]